MAMKMLLDSDNEFDVDRTQYDLETEMKATTPPPTYRVLSDEATRPHPFTAPRCPKSCTWHAPPSFDRYHGTTRSHTYDPRVQACTEFVRILAAQANTVDCQYQLAVF
eukprot:m.180764 g.180764  ORF g.180764 m.180764 type:complete len:108 (+) comp14952_c2_seq3:1272-1595(+)